MENRKKHFNVGEVKTRILEYLLRQDAPLKESEITEFLKNEYSQFDRATVNRHLRDLEKLKCVTKVTPAHKSRFNFWSIVTIKNVENIIKEYPDLIDSLRDSGVALNIVLDNLESALIASTDMKNIEEQKKNEEIKNKLSEIRENLKPKLEMSGSFFKLCIQDKYWLWRNLSDLMEIPEEGPVADLFIGDKFKFFINHTSGIDLAFKSCVVLDIMERKGNIRKDLRKEIEFIKEIKNTVPKKQLDQLKKYYENTDTAPIFMKGKKLVSVCNSELSIIETEFEDRGGEFIHYGSFEEPPVSA